MTTWLVERFVHFEPGEIVVDGLAHFGFRATDGRLYAVSHERHFLGPVGGDGTLEWTLAPQPVLEGVPNITAELDFPMFVDALADGTLVVSSFGNATLHRVDPEAMHAELLVDGRELGLVDMGNCVVDDDGLVWVNEVRGCRIWRFDLSGRPIETLGDGVAGFQAETAGFDEVRFSWIYDLRRGPGREIYALDSRNFAVRIIDVDERSVRVLAGDGRAGSETFGSDPAATFDGPISLAVDEDGNAFVGDRFNHVVRMVDGSTGRISTIAGRADATAAPNDPTLRDPLRVNLPAISSMDYGDGRLFVPTDLPDGSGDLVVLRRA